MPRRAWHRWRRSARDPRSAPARGGSGRPPSAPPPRPTPAARAPAARIPVQRCPADRRLPRPCDRECAQRQAGRCPRAPSSGQPSAIGHRGNAPLGNAGCRPGARPGSPRQRTRRKSTCHNSAATSSSVAVSDRTTASWPRYSKRPSSIRVMAETRIGSPQLIVEAATARRLRRCGCARRDAAHRSHHTGCGADRPGRR